MTLKKYFRLSIFSEPIFLSLHYLCKQSDFPGTGPKNEPLNSLGTINSFSKYSPTQKTTKNLFLNFNSMLTYPIFILP